MGFLLLFCPFTPASQVRKRNAKCIKTVSGMDNGPFCSIEMPRWSIDGESIKMSRFEWILAYGSIFNVGLWNTCIHYSKK